MDIFICGLIIGAVVGEWLRAATIVFLFIPCLFLACWEE